MPGLDRNHCLSERIRLQRGLFRSGLLWCIGLTLGLLLIGVPPVTADEALDEYNLSVQLFRQDRWALASESFRKFLKEHPQHEKAAVARMYLGLTHIKQADYKSARDEFRTFVKDYPQNQNLAQAKYRVAECSYLLNDLPAARIELQTYLKDHPEDELGERAWPYLGDAQLRLNNPAGAVSAFAEAVRKYPQGPLVDDAQFGWAKALEAQQQTAAAVQKYEALAKGDGPRAAESLFQLGSHEFDAGRFDAAARHYQSLVQRFPKSPFAGDAHLNAGFALFRQQDFAAAAQAFTQAEKDPERKLQAGYWNALCLKSESKWDLAISKLTELSQTAGEDPLAESILYQRGMCERQAGRPAAQQTLMSVVDRFPQGDSAENALHFATELALDAGDLDAVQTRLARFAKVYPQSGLRQYQDLLAGRLALAQATQATSVAAAANEIAAHYVDAERRFQSVLTNSMLPRTRQQARYYLALTQQLQNEQAAALKTLQPLIEELQADKTAHEFADAFVLQAECLLETGKPESAAQAAAAYLERVPQGRQRARALAARALALSEQQQSADALVAWKQLVAESPQSTIIPSTTLKLAEQADQRSDWPAASLFYRDLTTRAEGTELAIFGWRGLAWSEYRQRQFAAAADGFKKLVDQFPEHRLTPEARYYHGESLREQGQLADAGQAFTATFAALSPEKPAAAGAEQQPPLVFAYRAGLQAARMARLQKQVEAADKAYAAVLEKFPRPQHLDRLLDEWAVSNYEAERYDRADEIFRRLVMEVPDSDLADNARLSLAESDLLANRLPAARQAFEALRVSETAEPAVRERAHYQLIVLALEQRQWADVSRLSRDFTADFPESSLVNYARYAAAEAVLADAKATSERLESLLQELGSQTAAEFAPTDTWAPRLWVLAAETQFRLKRYDDIAITVDDLKKKWPEGSLNYQAEEVLGRALKQQARFPESRAALDRVLSDKAAFRTETAAKSQFLIAETWFLQEQWKEALLAYQKVYASYAFPEWQSAALLQSGKCDEQLGNLKDAIATYDRLIAEFPTSPHLDDARQRLAQVKRKAGAK